MPGVINSFELPLEQYVDDVKVIVDSTVEKYGIREWKIVTLTNEIHGHLGIYSTIGAKMGLRAREWFESQGCDSDISVISFAGNRPPVSCFNDGIQISTGATLGHGLISVSEEEDKRTEAIFCCEQKQIRLRLKEEYEKQIRDDIRKGVGSYGHSPEYWMYVRRLALRYWSQWDRKTIFTEKLISL